MTRFVRRTTVTLTIVMLSLCLYAPQAAAQPYPTSAVDRPLALPGGVGQGAIGTQFNLKPDDAFDAVWMPLAFSYGLIDRLELGVSTAFMLNGPDGADVVNNLTVGALYQFLGNPWGGAGPYLAAGLDFHIPVTQVGDRRLVMDLNIPFKYVIAKKLFSAGIALDFIFNLFKDAETISLFVPIELTVTPIDTLFIDLAVGFGYPVMTPSGVDGELTIPLMLSVGYTIQTLQGIDIGLFVQLPDLKGLQADAINMGLNAAVRF
jgi:hypothetical protein